MRIIEKDFEKLKEMLKEMWALVISQIKYSGEALLKNEKELAEKIIKQEQIIDALEVKISDFCEELIALYAPVAVDLRLILSTLGINNNLERIADFAEGIAKFVKKIDNVDLEADLIKRLEISEMFEILELMLEISKASFFEENLKLAKNVIEKDVFLNRIKKKSTNIVEEYIRENNDRIYECLRLQGIIRKLERAGDHCVNIAEEIIFCIDAKNVKHRNLKD